MTALLLLSVLSGLTPAANEQEQSFTFRAQVQRVYVDVFVERDGRPVHGLEARDFVVLDEGRTVHDVTLLDPSDYPLDAVLLLDASDSVRGPILDELKAGVRNLAEELHPRDHAALITFGTRYRLRKGLQDASTSIRSAIDRMIAGGGTALLDGLYAAIVHAEGGTGRPFVVVFSDGEDNASWLTVEEVVATAQSSNAVVYAVSLEESSRVFGREVLQSVTEATGGEILSIQSISELEEIFARVLRQMRSRYLLFFEPAAGARRGLHEIEVRLRGASDASVRARKTYVLR